MRASVSTSVRWRFESIAHTPNPTRAYTDTHTHILTLSHSHTTLTQVSAEIENLSPSYTRTTITITFTLHDEDGAVVSTSQQQVAVPQGNTTAIVQAVLTPPHPLKVRRSRLDLKHKPTHSS